MEGFIAGFSRAKIKEAGKQMFLPVWLVQIFR